MNKSERGGMELDTVEEQTQKENEAIQKGVVAAPLTSDALATSPASQRSNVDEFLLVDELSGMDLSQPPTDDSMPMKLPKTPVKTPQISHRSSRSIRALKRPQPQPHVCVLDKTLDGQCVFINVLSWTKIVKPKHPLDPIPLFGGIRISSANPIYKSLLIYAVTANPEVLENTRRNYGNAHAQYALMLLMTEFVEAMNPGLKLKKQPEILEDRDLTGELKEIWLKLQSKREKDKFSAMTDDTSNIFYEEFGPPDSTAQSSTLLPNNDMLVHSPQEATAPPGQDPSAAMPTEIHVHPINPPAYDSVQKTFVEPVAESEIDFSINPYLVPYPEQDSQTVTESVPTDDKLDAVSNAENTESAPPPVDPVVSVSPLPSPTEIDATPTVTEKEVVEKIPVMSSPTTEDSSKSSSNNQQLESIKKSLEFITNGCHNFFLFKSKNNQSENGTTGSRKKEAKEKSSKSNKKSVKSNSKSPAPGAGANNTTDTLKPEVNENQSTKSDIFKGKLRNSAEDENEFAIKT